MAEPIRVGLDNPAFSGRLRAPHRIRSNEGAAKRPSARYFNAHLTSENTARRPSTPPQPVWAQKQTTERAIDRQPDKTPTPTSRPELPKIQTQAEPAVSATQDTRRGRLFGYYTLQQKVLFGLALLLFAGGGFVSLQTLHTNHAASAQVSALSQKADNQGGQNDALPSTTKPSSAAVKNYVVAPDLPRYIKIPKLSVNARVLQVGVTSSGALGTPNNVYDAAWYTGSSKPGQPGAMLIDGHVSSWTTRGVFYGLKRLVAGDKIQIQRGDGQVFNYQVVKSQMFADDNVDMQAAVRPVTAGKQGLNLISCIGKVKKGTNEFDHRIIVFAEQVD